MRAFDPEVFDALWAAVEPLIPRRNETHPLGCHRPRKSDRDCFMVIMVRLATGCSWEDAEQITGRVVSDTTARERRDEWVAAGVFDAIAAEAIAGYDKVIGLDLSEVAIDGSTHKAPVGGEGTGKSPIDRGKLGWKWSIATDAVGIPIGWAIGGANRHDIRLLVPTIEAVRARGLLADIDTLWLDRGLRRQDDQQVPDPYRSRRRHGRQEAVPGTRQELEDVLNGVALAGGADQLVAVELWADAAQYRPQDRPPTLSAGLGDCRHLDRKADRLAEPLEPRSIAYPLSF